MKQNRKQMKFLLKDKILIINFKVPSFSQNQEILIDKLLSRGKQSSPMYFLAKDDNEAFYKYCELIKIVDCSRWYFRFGVTELEIEDFYKGFSEWIDRYFSKWREKNMLKLNQRIREDNEK
jgi:hypothetical protein